MLSSRRYVFAGVALAFVALHFLFGFPLSDEYTMNSIKQQFSFGSGSDWSVDANQTDAGIGFGGIRLAADGVGGSGEEEEERVKVLDSDVIKSVKQAGAAAASSSSSSSSSSSHSTSTSSSYSNDDLDTFPQELELNHAALTDAENTRANATFVIVCRNKDLNGVVSSMQQMEDRFNRKHGYSWVLLNEEPFTDEFERRVKIITSSPVHFGLIPAWQWYQPDWIDEKLAEQNRRQLQRQRIIYADSVPYRNMCRYNSGFFFKHELLQQYRYYWRPDVKFFCDINYDPFKFMQENDKVYSFTISLKEIGKTITTLWDTVTEFINDYPEYVHPGNAMSFLSNDGGKSFNLCHYWSNFEIADMDFWRGEAYEAFFDHLESKGGFYYERWGDAPIHSIAASLFARKDQIHFFSDIGYQHDSFSHCPRGKEWRVGRCACDPQSSFDYTKDSCLARFERMFGPDEGRHLKDRTSKAKAAQLPPSDSTTDTTDVGKDAAKESKGSNVFESRPKGPDGKVGA